LKNTPLVSVICLCYNHERYVAEALLSVLNQTYPRIELIIVDDASNDHSVEVIEKLIEGVENVNFIRLQENHGNCIAFNLGFKASSGDYIIDLAADDVLIKTRVERGVEEFLAHSKEFGVHFTDAMYIDEYSSVIGYHYERDQYGSLVNSVSEGDVYKTLVEKYLVCTPTMMIKRSVMEFLEGYDESLAYEDFDFWVRSARNFKYMYTDQILVKKRALSNSMSKSHFKEAKFMESTLKVCRKIYKLNTSEEENKALKVRVRYEMRQAIINNHYDIAHEFYDLFRDSNGGFLLRGIFWLIINLRPDLRWMRRFQGEPI